MRNLKGLHANQKEGKDSPSPAVDEGLDWHHDDGAVAAALDGPVAAGLMKVEVVERQGRSGRR